MYSINLGNKLRKLLFERDDRALLENGSPVTYDIKPGLEANAAKTWAIHGVCLKCRRWSISRARCVECATIYSELKGHYIVIDMKEQCLLADRLTGEP